MKKEDFQTGWRRLSALLEFTNKQEENLDILVAEYWKEYGQSSPEFWEKCVDRIINEPSRRFFPSLGEMAAVAEQIREKARQVGCERCDGTGFVLVEVNGTSGVRPCSCRAQPQDDRKRSGSGGLRPIKEIAG